MKPALAVCLAAGLAASGTLYGQTMIEYGVGIGRAGAAGAATGAGAAGIFSGVKGSLEQKPDTAKPRQATAEEKTKVKKAETSESEQTSNAKTEEKEEAQSAPVLWNSGTLTTSSGFVISGLQRRPTRAAYGPSSTGPVVEVAPTPAAQSSSGQEPAPASGPDAAAPVPSAAAGNSGSATSGVFHPIVTQFGDARVATSRPSITSTGAATANVDIPVGTPVDELIQRFGEPLMALTGISGEDYTEKYVFKTPDGARVTVLGIDGKVTNAVVQRDAGARAAL